MNPTSDTADELLVRAKRRAREENTTLRELVEEGLRRRLAVEPRPRPFRLKRRAVAGEGLQRSIAEGDWEQIRDLIYKLG